MSENGSDIAIVTLHGRATRGINQPLEELDGLAHQRAKLHLLLDETDLTAV